MLDVSFKVFEYCIAFCRIMLSSPEDHGQERVIRAVLHLFEGCNPQVVSLVTLMMTGGGDATVGLFKLVKEALQR